MAKDYRIKEAKDLGHGPVHLFCDGDWLESFATRELAEAELKARQEFDRIRSEQHK